MKMKRLLSFLFAAACLSFSIFGVYAGTPYAPGDVSGDGEITAEDARLCLRLAVSLENFPEGSDAYRACDVDGEPGISASDARLILRAAVGLDELHVHAFGAWAPEKNANGVFTGRHIHTCSVCGEVQSEDCAYSEKTPTTEIKSPTCTQDCTFTQNCTVCGAVITTTERALGHSFGDWIPEKDASGAATGRHTSTCSRCAVTESRDCTLGDKTFLTENKAPTCTQSCTYTQTCSVCGVEKRTEEAALGHTYIGQISVDQDKICERCGEQTPCFNTLVNALKKGGHVYTGFSESVNSGVVTKEEIWISPTAKLIATLANEPLEEKALLQQIKDEIAKEGHAYEDYVFQRDLINENYYLAGRNVVSELADADADSITAVRMTGIDFLASLPDTIQVKSKFSNETFTVNLAEKIKAANIGDVLKVTVTLKDVRYSEIKDADTPTALQRSMDFDLRELVDGLNQSQNQDGMKYELSCTEATSNCVITYYFDAQTMQPIAAVYDLTVDSAETVDVEMRLDTDITIRGKQISGKVMTCNLGIQMQSNSVFYFFFDHYFD